MKKNILVRLFGLVLVSLSITACSSITIEEQGFLRDRQQAILYYLTRFGASRSDDIAKYTYYPVESIEKSLKKLQEKSLVDSNSDVWSVTNKYLTNEHAYVEAIKLHSEEKISAALTHHQYTKRTIVPEGVQFASFVSSTAEQTIIVFPGNGFNLVPDVKEILKLLEPNRNVFVIEYPGMGGSKGELTVQSLRNAAQKFYELISQDPAVQGTKLIIYGFSLGGFVATDIAASNDVDALILDATAPDMQSWIDANVPLYAKAFVRVEADDALKKVSNISIIKRLSCPILFIAGSQDEITPPEMMKTLHDSAVNTKYKSFVILDGVAHGESLDHSDFKPLLSKFLSALDEKTSQ